VSGYVATSTTRLRLADAVAASAALPGALAPLVLKHLNLPCELGRTPKIVDGGAYDNMGLEVLDSLVRGELIVALNAGGLFRTGMRFGRIPFVRDLSRSNSLLYRQSTALRRRELVDRFRAWEDAGELGLEPPSWGRRGVLFGLSRPSLSPTSSGQTHAILVMTCESRSPWSRRPSRVLRARHAMASCTAAGGWQAPRSRRSTEKCWGRRSRPGETSLINDPR
jgi:hypothetical protein